MNCLHPLEELEGVKLNGYTLHLGRVKQLHLSGWKGFTPFVSTTHGVRSENAVVSGIYSVGGKDGMKPWMDVIYGENMLFSTGEGGERQVFSM